MKKFLFLFVLVAVALKGIAAPFDIGEAVRKAEFWSSDPVMFVKNHTEEGFSFTSETREGADSRYYGAVAFFSLPAYETKVTFSDGGISRVEAILFSSGGSETYEFGVDMQGIGAALSRNCDLQDPDDFFNPYGCDYHFNSCEIMFDSSMLCRRTMEILGAVAYARSRGVKKFSIHGHGLGAIPAVMAAILCDDIRSVKLTDAPESFDRMAREYITMWPQAVMLRGILKYTDLPDMYEALKAEKELVIGNFVNNYFER